MLGSRCALSVGQPLVMTFPSLAMTGPFCVYLSGRACVAVFNRAFGWRSSNSNRSLKTSKPVTLASIGIDNAALDSVSAT